MPDKPVTNLKTALENHKTARANLWDEIDAAVAAAAQELERDRESARVSRSTIQPGPAATGNTAAEDST